MKSFFVLLLACLAHGRTVGTMGKRQLGDALTGLLMPISKPAKVDNLAPKIRTTAKRARALFGPYDFKPAKNETGPKPMAMMAGMQMDPNGQVAMKRLDGFCRDCTVIHGSAYVANDKGERLEVKDGAYIHHLLIMNPSKKVESYFNCGGGKPNMPSDYFLGSGVDDSEYWFTNKDGTYNSGYYIGTKEAFMMQYEIINYSPEPQKWYIAADYEYMDGRPAGAEDVSVTDFNVNNCFGFAEAGYKPPVGQQQFSKQSPDFVMTRDGTFLYAMGHLHDGGTNIQLVLNNKTVCDSKAIYGGEKGTHKSSDGTTWESIALMSTCQDPIPVQKGDVMSMISLYDTKLHPLRESGGFVGEAMGIYTLFFASKASPPQEKPKQVGAA